MNRNKVLEVIKCSSLKKTTPLNLCNSVVEEKMHLHNTLITPLANPSVAFVTIPEISIGGISGVTHNDIEQEFASVTVTQFSMPVFKEA